MGASGKKAELIAATICFAGILLFLRPLLFVGTYTFPHDNLYWNYPLFRFFAHTLLNGELPVWNPFSHGGEPFYPLWGQMRLYDPVTLVMTGLISRFTQNLLLLFHWVRLGQILFYLAGIYFFLRSECKSTFVRVSLIVILFFSSTFLCSLRQDGIIHSFLWAPWATYFFREYLRNGGWKVGLAFTICVGVNFQSYFFAGTWIWFFFLFTGVLLFHRKDVFLQFTDSSSRKRNFWLACLLILFALPNLAVVADSKDFLFPARTAPHDYEKQPPNGGPFSTEPRPWDYEAPLKLPYSFVKATGGHSSWMDFLQLLSPEGNLSLSNRPRWAWGDPSDSYTFIGILPFLLALLGMVIGVGEWKRVMLWTTSGIGLFALGPLAGVHRLLFAFFPPVWFIRNTSCLILFFQFGLLYFFVLGANAFWGRTLQEVGRWRLGAFAGICATYLGLLLFFSSEKWSWGIPLVLVVSLFYFFRFRKSVFLLLLTCDLLLRFYRSDALYATQRPLEETFRVSTENTALRPFQKRMVAPAYPLGVFHQVPRYLELVELKPYAFSSSFIFPPVPWKVKPTGFETVWRNYRWNSYLLLKNYFRTVYEDKSPYAFADSLRIDTSPIAFRRTIAGKSTPLPFGISQRGYASVKIIADVPGRGWLYYADGFHKYWTTKIDGNEVKPVLADGMFKSVPIDGGKHEISFQYRPWPFLLGLAAYYFAFLGGLAGILFLALRDSFSWPQMIPEPA